MLSYRFLDQSDFDALYDCFLAVFADYEVNMRAAKEEFEQRLLRDGVQLDMSAAAFDNDAMIGFCINGTGFWQGLNTVYDAGTGVLPDYRGQGVAKRLFDFMAPRLKEAEFRQYLLEVLSSNGPAVALYRKLGFKETRTLAVFRSGFLIDANDTNAAKLCHVSQPHWTLYQSFWDSQPSWQNSIAAVERIATGRCLIEAHAGEECIGYGVVAELTGNLLQLAVVQTQRRRGVGTQLLTALQKKVAARGPLKVNNIDRQCQSALSFYEANGFRLALNQYEMMKTL